MVYLKAVAIGLSVLAIIALKNLSAQLGSLERFVRTAYFFQGNAPSKESGISIKEEDEVISESSTSAELKEELKLGDFHYPEAEVVNFGGNSFLLKTSDSVEVVTDWYKKRISDKKMGIKNFIQTRTNDNFSNLLQGKGEKEDIKVEIEKESNDSKVSIIVTINSFNN